MSGFLGIIFYVVVISIFINAKNAAQKEGKRGTSSKRTQTPNVSVNRRNVMTKVPEIKKVTEPKTVPNQKRESDYRENYKNDSWQQNRRKYDLWGEDEYAAQRVVALRLMEGDPVPENYRKVKCPYCGADNLVVKGSKQYHSCYFCRVAID